LAAIAVVKSRLNPTTGGIVDRLLAGAEPNEEDLGLVDEESTTVWVESGRRSTMTKRLAAHLAVEHYLRGSFEAAIYSAEYALPYCHHGRARTAHASVPEGAT